MKACYQVRSYALSDVHGETPLTCGPCFPVDDQSGAYDWGVKYIESFPDEYVEILKIWYGGRTRSGGRNQVVWDSREPDQRAEDESVYQQMIALR